MGLIGKVIKFKEDKNTLSEGLVVDKVMMQASVPSNGHSGYVRESVSGFAVQKIGSSRLIYVPYFAVISEKR